MAYNLVEAVLALYAGWRASSIALVGFGFDSVIESVAAVALLYRLSIATRGADPSAVERVEERARKLVGVTFLLLATYVVIQSGFVLYGRRMPEESLLGIVIASVSLVVMPIVAFGKLRAARHIGSRALEAEAKETIACTYLSFTLLLGLGANALFGAWWADPLAALLMVPWLAKEGREALFGEDRSAAKGTGHCGSGSKCACRERGEEPCCGEGGGCGGGCSCGSARASAGG
jgi:divalent metal cation (Fe/Co/Zn/Cd) transporter